jgi:hypothetical protein
MRVLACACVRLRARLTLATRAQGRERSPQPELRLAQELREAASLLVALAPFTAVSSDGLSGSVPILVDAEEWEEIAEALDDEFLGDASVWRRPSSGAADPSGGDFPYLSPEGYTLLDLIFEEGLRIAGVAASAADVAAAIESVPGVLAHGLEAGGRVHAAIVAAPPGAGAAAPPRVLLPYLRDATDAQRALARGT